MEFVYSDGGRSKYFKAENVGDCVTRAICNATGKDYLEVYNRLKEMSKCESVKRHRGHKRSSVRNGVFKETWKRYLKEIGWVHHSVTSIGNSDRRMRLTKEDLPSGNLIVQISKHLTNVKDGVIYDTYNCSSKQYYDRESGDLLTNDERCVYGYWTAPTKEQIESKNKADEIISKQKESIKETKQKVKKIKDKYNKDIKLLKRKIKALERKRDKEIKKIKEEDAKQFMNNWLDEAEKDIDRNV